MTPRSTHRWRTRWPRAAPAAAIVAAIVFGPASCRARPVPPAPHAVNLRAFGAVGDGVADDGPALQRALDAIAAAGGGTLLVPAGRYALVTPVAKDFSRLAGSVTIRGAVSSTPIDTKGGAEQLSSGLNLTSEFLIKAGHPNVALTLSGLTTLLVVDVGFTGTPGTRSDARVALMLRGIADATIRHCEFYGLSSLDERGAIVHADGSGLSIDQTAFLGTTGNSGHHNSVVLATKWKHVSVTESVFIDYGQRPGFLGKLGLAAAYAWIMIGDAAPVDADAPRRDATIRDVFMDEGGYRAIASVPEWYDHAPRPADLIYISDYRLNVSNLGSAAIHIERGAQHVMVERAAFGFSTNAGPAVQVNSINDAILDNVTCTAAVKTIVAGPAVNRLTVTNSTCSDVQSQAQTTTVFGTAPAAGPVQFVRDQFLAALGTEPPAAAHFDWSSRLLPCRKDQTCLGQRATDLTAFLTQAAAR